MNESRQAPTCRCRWRSVYFIQSIDESWNERGTRDKPPTSPAFRKAVYSLEITGGDSVDVSVAIIRNPPFLPSAPPAKAFRLPSVHFHPRRPRQNPTPDETIMILLSLPSDASGHIWDRVYDMPKQIDPHFSLCIWGGGNHHPKLDEKHPGFCGLESKNLL